jgi:hypothetical protein
LLSSKARSAVQIHTVRPQQQVAQRRTFADSKATSETAKKVEINVGKATAETTKKLESNAEKAASGAGASEEPKKGIWNNVHFWATAGAVAGWGMSGAAIYDATQSGPEVISMNMTGVLLVYSTLFARWGWIVLPRNGLLAACHATNVVAQANQMRRALEYKMANGKEDEVYELAKNTGMMAATGAGFIAFGPQVQRAVMNAKMGPVSDFAASPAGPFTVHFWAPMSKWLISGASFMDFDRPTDQVSLPQYTALTLTGLFFSRYALLVTPVNYMLCSVNIALFGSSFYHLARKIKADYM